MSGKPIDSVFYTLLAAIGFIWILLIIVIFSVPK